MLERLPFAANSYRARSLPLSSQRLVNLYPEKAPDEAKNKVVLYGTEGQVRFSNLTNIRGLHRMAGVLYAVAGNKLYSVASDGAATQLGEVSALGDVFLENNGKQLCIVTSPTAYIYSVLSGLNEISDPDFPGASSVAYLDGYFIFTTPDTGEFFITALYDGTDIDALDYATAESNPDKAVRVFVDHREIWVFGEESTEIWYNSGNADFPFERIPNAILDKGCASARTAAKSDNTVFWLGDDLIIYRADGYTPKRISTHPIETVIRENPDNISAFSYSTDGHAFYVLSLPGVATFVYDAATNWWHERESYGAKGWNPTVYAKCYGKHFVGGDKIYQLDPDIYDDDGKPLVAKATSVVYGDNTDTVHIMSQLQLDIEAGIGTTTGQGSDPQAMLRFSDDGGKTWSTELWQGLGKIGEYKRRAVWRRLGMFRQRVIEISISDPVKRAITGIFGGVNNG